MKFRYELKHYINFVDYKLIKNRLDKIATLDINANSDGNYKIRSLYFDDYNDSMLSAKIMGLNNRYKFRIRMYNDDDSYIKLEKKSKSNGLCNKISSIITKDECIKILDKDIKFLSVSDNALFNELYIKMNSGRQVPKTIVDYTRCAYIYNPGNVRITFDTCIKTGLSSTHMFDPNLATMQTLNPRYIVLEIKYDEFLPDIITDLVQLGNRSKTSLSKYALCRMYI